MGGRDAVRMSDTEVQQLLAENIKVQVATIGRDGAPHLTTLFYVLEEGLIGFWTYARSQKVRNLERDPRVSCLVEDGTDYFELRGVSVTGRARIVRDHDHLLDLGGRVVARMAGADTVTELGAEGLEAVERQARKRVGILVEPESVATWDHRKMLGGTPSDGGE